MSHTLIETSQTRELVPQVQSTEAVTQAQGSESKGGIQKPKPEKSQARDINRTLELMGNGVLVELHIARPNFTTRLTQDDLALGLAGSDLEILRNFKLGQLRLLPAGVLHRLDNAESAARACLYRRSFEFGRSRFVPANLYEKWEAENEKYLAQFEAIAQEIVEQYEGLCVQVKENYRAVAERNWLDLCRRKLADITTSQKRKATLDDWIRVSEDVAQKEQFIEVYLKRIESHFLSVEAVKARFSYQVNLSRIALPTELARDKAEADELTRQNREREAQLHKRLELIRLEQEKLEAEVWAKREVEREKAALEKQAEREAAQRNLRIEEEKTKVELTKIEQRRKIDEAILAQYKTRSAEIVDEFFGGVMREVNVTISEACRSVLASLDKNGRLIGKSNEQLHNLVTKLGGYRDYLQDKALAQKVEDLLAVLPAAPSVSTKSKGKQKQNRAKVVVNLAPLRMVLSEMQREADAVLIEVENTVERAQEPLAEIKFGSGPHDEADQQRSPLTVDLATTTKRQQTYSDF